jgi:hypothetical protein
MWYFEASWETRRVAAIGLMGIARRQLKRPPNSA